MNYLLQKIRNATPLSLRQKVGPYMAYVAYLFRIYAKGNPHQPNVMSLEETLDAINKERLSVIRFGDGEMSLIENIDLGFQKKNQELAEKLKIILQSNKDGLLICIPGIFGKLGKYNKKSFYFFIHHMFRHGHDWNRLLNRGQRYGDAFISRPYLNLKDASKAGNIFKKLFLLWEDKEVVLIEGSKSRLGIGNDMFNSVKSIKRILCPSENAYSKYSEIKSQALKIDKSKLILLSLGPAAKVLAYDLFNEGYRVLDIGHIDMEYEMFLRKEAGIVKVKYKYFNEIGERAPEECDDRGYKDQIMAIIN